MKSLLMYVLAFCIASSPLQALRAAPADANPYYTPAADYKVAFSSVVYSLSNLDQVLADLGENHNRAAAHAIGKTVAIEIYKRMSAAIEMLGVTINDPSLDEETRKDSVIKLTEAIGELMFIVLRQRGDTKNTQDLSLKVTSVEAAVSVFREAMLDATALGPTFSENREVMWAPIERIHRERLTKDLIGKLQDFATRALPDVKDDTDSSDKVRRTLRDFEAPMMLKIKNSRLWGQRAMTAIYLGMAVWAVFNPLFDSVGWLEGGRSENSLFVSSMMYFSVWMTFAITKALTISQGSIVMLKDLITLLNDPGAQIKQAGWFGSLKERIGTLGHRSPAPGMPVSGAAATRRTCDALFLAVP